MPQISIQSLEKLKIALRDTPEIIDSQEFFSEISAALQEDLRGNSALAKQKQIVFNFLSYLNKVFILGQEIQNFEISNFSKEIPENAEEREFDITWEIESKIYNFAKNLYMARFLIQSKNDTILKTELFKTFLVIIAQLEKFINPFIRLLPQKARNDLCSDDSLKFKLAHGIVPPITEILLEPAA